MPAADPLAARRVFRLLVLYRWLSLIPAGLALWAGPPAGMAAAGMAAAGMAAAGGALLAAALASLFITLVPARLNRAVRRFPALLLADLLLCAALAALTGGWSTPYYLYAFSPLLAAAFFFELRGALLGAGGMAGLFVVAGLLGAGIPANPPQFVAQVVGFFLIAGAMGYATSLLARLQSSHVELNRAHRDLEVIHSLTLSLQSAADVNEVEQRVLTAVTDELGFPGAIVALVDQNEGVITAWLGRSRDGRPLFSGGMPHPARVPLTAEAGVIPAAVLDGQPRLSLSNPTTPDELVNRNLRGGTFHLFPMLHELYPQRLRPAAAPAARAGAGRTDRAGGAGRNRPRPIAPVHHGYLAL
ncbi:MAG: hypothetical protein HY784_14245 [Chloroflexi bacterium]|nr:hypothetical protein [Chloroflexota bacterium]